jgi:hypothetical protein
MTGCQTLIPFFFKAGVAPNAPPIIYKAKIQIIFLMAIGYL